MVSKIMQANIPPRYVPPRYWSNIYYLVLTALTTSLSLVYVCLPSFYSLSFSLSTPKFVCYCWQYLPILHIWELLPQGLIFFRPQRHCTSFFRFGLYKFYTVNCRSPHRAPKVRCFLRWEWANLFYGPRKKKEYKNEWFPKDTRNQPTKKSAQYTRWPVQSCSN